MPLFIPEDPRPIHFMGIAGAGMSALARIARAQGAAVTGCDLNPAGSTDLTDTGFPVVQGHGADHVSGVQAVVYTAAVPRDHPELAAARAAGIRVLTRAEALAVIVSVGRTAAIGGTHGKTTTTAMVAMGMRAAGMAPTALVGGRVPEWGGNAVVGRSDLFVVEADEYDRSFLTLYPEIAVINNVEADHLECYGSLEELELAFVEFAGRGRQVLVGADDAGAARVAERLTGPVWRVGVAPRADIRLTEVKRDCEGSAAALELVGGERVELRLRVPGIHNLRNAAMAVGVVSAFGGDVHPAAEALAEFAGVDRRFQTLGSARGVTVVDDYAHHPTEAAATLAAARDRFPGRRVVAVFQPHLFSRTREHGEALGIVLAAADVVVVTEVYPAREKPVPGVSGLLVADAARRAGAEVVWIAERGAVAREVAKLVGDGDVVLTMGAGDITEVGPELLQRLEGAAA